MRMVDLRCAKTTVNCITIKYRLFRVVPADPRNRELSFAVNHFTNRTIDDRRRQVLKSRVSLYKPAYSLTDENVDTVIKYGSNDLWVSVNTSKIFKTDRGRTEKTFRVFGPNNASQCDTRFLYGTNASSVETPEE